MTGDILQAFLEENAKLRIRISEIENALRDAIEGWHDCSLYKSDYLREKHGDAEGIAAARAVLENKGGRSHDL